MLVEQLIMYSAMLFIIWELQLIFNKRLLYFHINSTRKSEYKRIERITLTLYTIFLLLGLFFENGKYIAIILAIKLLIEVLINLKYKKTTKVWIVRIHSLISALILCYYVYLIKF